MAGVRGKRATFPVSEEVFKAVYDSPKSLPGKHSWVTPDTEVRKIEKLLGIPKGSIGAPLWVSGDTQNCANCGRETTWLDVVSSALNKVHRRELLITVILGDQKFVNVEAPRAIADLVCYRCKHSITDLRSFKCHNWAYAVGAMRQLIAESAKQSS